ncbi:hypothetical protein HNP81_001389 [Peribacillus huizhouensis]|uniref:Uncharacterized protein n=1 Tax=Peribacillus huizhouensis TaxID=1501239 RepID=A0ABR6CM48_9BACI|nr:hypothetical protein [Peribacillus huizhouensis]
MTSQSFFSAIFLVPVAISFDCVVLKSVYGAKNLINMLTFL